MKDNNSVAIIATLVLVGGLVTAGLLYGMFIYNHSQDVARDKFLIEHCTKVKSDLKTPDWNSSQEFTCEATK